MDTMVIVIAVVLGLAAGSFANVPIQRWPRGSSVTVPARSQCPDCGRVLRWSENVPVVSWLVQRGRCRGCGTRIRVRYLLVEGVTGALFGGVVAVHWPDPVVGALLVFAWGLVVASAIDLEHRIIPDRLTLRLPTILAVLLVPVGLLADDTDALVRAGVGALLVPGVMLLLSEVFRRLRGQAGIGMGDVKLGLSLGMVVGYLGGLHLAVFAYASVIAAVVVALVLMALGRVRMASRIPFGPYLAFGALVVVLFGDVTTGFLTQLLGL